MTFFTSDPHFWHHKVIEYCNRPFETVEQMNAELIRRHNEVVGPDDTVYYGGDMFFCGTTRAKEILRQLNGKKRLIRGNHDFDKLKPRRAEEFGFEWIKDTETIEIGGQPVLMSHFPYRKKDGDGRYFEHQPEDGGGWLIHGHVHGLWKTRGRMINIGVDVWDFRPVSLEQIQEIMV